jgi:hypothetical protein
MKWCCQIFEGWHRESGKRGLGVFVDTSTYDKPLFLLQFRAIDSDLKFPNFQTTNDNMIVSPIAEIGITFCPWCGRDLMKWYKNDLRALVKNDLRT